MSMLFNKMVERASMERLQQLIEARVQPGAQKEEIDKRIWKLFGEKWAVIFTDLSGFSRGVTEFGIVHFLQVIFESQRLFIPCIEKYNGILVKYEGDSLLIVFRDVMDALYCSVAMQKAAHKYNVDRADTEKILLCLGIGYGDVLKIGDDDVFGAEVNAASKLGEDTAEPWEILITEKVRQAVEKLAKGGYEELDVPVPGTDKAYRFLYDL